MASSSTNQAKRKEKKGGSNKRWFLREWCRPVNLQFREGSVNLSTGWEECCYVDPWTSAIAQSFRLCTTQNANSGIAFHRARTGELFLDCRLRLPSLDDIPLVYTLQ